jgi:hypothetical protein
MPGVCTQGPVKGFVSIPVGTIISIDSDGEKTNAYLTARWADQELLVFSQDLLDKAVEYNNEQAAKSSP